jgi:elongator complex protein 3
MKRDTWLAPYSFSPEEHERELLGIIHEIREGPRLDSASLHRVLVKYPKNGNSFFSKSEIIRGYRYFAEREGWNDEADSFIEKIRMKPVRTLSGVTPVTVLTQPFPCPGQCIFCPNDVQMPKSYLSREPGAQRAARHDFDPYRQMMARLGTLDIMGHPVDKVELIVLGGTWSSYPESYQLWFLKRCFDAMNDIESIERWNEEGIERHVDFNKLDQEVNGRFETNPYNDIVSGFLRCENEGAMLHREESATWKELLEAHRVNETSRSRCIGLSVETRPDLVTEEEAVRIRRLGATKAQIGIQSLSDDVLRLNKRGHDVATTRRAMKLLRQAGFKLQAHWMPNLYGSSPDQDVEDFARLFSEPDFRPDELKIYPCSLIESAELMNQYEAGAWRPYTDEELTGVLTECLRRVEPYCRISRVIRDIPGEDILVGNKMTNFRLVAEAALGERGWVCRDIRAREIRDSRMELEELELEQIPYETSVGKDVFLQFVTGENKIVAFLRLCLPDTESYIDELDGSALIREVHVYGTAVNIGKKGGRNSQHLGLGTRLIHRARDLARDADFSDLAVISSVGTREYYRKLGFRDGTLYQHLSMSPP